MKALGHEITVRTREVLAKGRRALDRGGQFTSSFDADYYRSQLASIGMTATEPDLLEFYRQNAAARVVSPNALFDEAYYLAQYADVMAAVQSGRILSGFDHFVHNGIKEGRFPNRDFEIEVDSNVATAVVVSDKELDEEFYLEEYPAARQFIRQMPVLAPIQFFNIYGRRMGHAPRADMKRYPSSTFVNLAYYPAIKHRDSEALDLIRPHFDPEEIRRRTRQHTALRPLPERWATRAQIPERLVR